MHMICLMPQTTAEVLQRSLSQYLQYIHDLPAYTYYTVSTHWRPNFSLGIPPAKKVACHTRENMLADCRSHFQRVFDHGYILSGRDLRVVYGSLCLDPTRPGGSLTRPDPRLLTKILTRPDPRPDPSPEVFNLIIID